jgi:peptidoglycan-associated lipoprotein
VNSGQGEPSDEYNRLHGRSSNGLTPVYFDFDQAVVRSDMAERMVQNAEFLKQINNTVVIEGNCDDRGTKEYNLALGEKRAINARDYLINLGIDRSRIRTVSYGEERPLFFEQTEFAWSQNRRADFVIE